MLVVETVCLDLQFLWCLLLDYSVRALTRVKNTTPAVFILLILLLSDQFPVENLIYNSFDISYQMEVIEYFKSALSMRLEL